MCRFVVFLSAVFVLISIVNRFPTSARTRLFDCNPGFGNSCAYVSTGHLFSSQSVPLLLLFEHSRWHFRLRKVWHPEVLNFSATGNLQFFFIDIFGDNLWLAHQILVSGLFFRRLPPFTLWMDFPEAVKQIYPFVPRAFHSLWVSWRTSDIKTRNFVFLLL